MSKTPKGPVVEQGELFPTVIKEGAQQAQILDAPEAGVFPSDIDVAPGHITLAVHDAAVKKKAEATRNRSEAQKGKHTVHEGESPKPGDVMPGPDGTVTPVTWNNLNAAKQVFAAEQNARDREAVNRPTLFGDVMALAVEAANDHAVDTVLAAPKREDNPSKEAAWPKLDTLSKRLEVIVEQAIDANFIPATKDEITDTLPMLEKPGTPGAVHDELMGTYYRQKGVARKKGYSPQVQRWEGQRALISRIYEVADYVADARGAFLALSELEQAVGKTNDLPMISAGEVFKDNPRALMGLRALARDALILQLEDQKLSEDALDFKSMTAREVRTYKRPELPVLESNTDEAKAIFATQRAAVEQQVKERTGAYSDEELLQRDKTLYSPFIPVEGIGSEELEAYVSKFISETTIGELRRTHIAHKLASLQQNRYWHHRSSIADVRGSTYRRVTGPILDKYPAGLVAA